MDVKFKFEKFHGLMSLGVKIRPFPLTLHVGLTTVQRYRAACDLQFHTISTKVYKLSIDKRLS